MTKQHDLVESLWISMDDITRFGDSFLFVDVCLIFRVRNDAASSADVLNFRHKSNGNGFLQFLSTIPNGYPFFLNVTSWF